ncbi:MAG TPA: alpha/beta hydrolase [Clostridiaceae bacterium]|nr:alpha/beta hydrolase [Clostridiaceae bacterium]
MRIDGITYVSHKTHKLRTFFIVIALLILLAFITVIALSAYVAWNILHPEKAAIKPFSSNIVPDYSNISIPVGDKGITLSGWFFKKLESDKTVILAHDYGKNRLQFEEDTMNIVKGFLNKGYNVLTFDFRNSGKSGGSLTSMGVLEKDDLTAVINYTTRVHNSKHIVLMGFCTGANASILAGAKAKNVDAVILDSPYTDFDDYVNYRAKKWNLPLKLFRYTIPKAVKVLGNINTDDINPIGEITDLSPRPVLFIHGKDDSSVPVSNSRELYALYSKTSSNNTELWEVEGAGHLESYNKNPETYISRVLKFLDTVYSS